MTSTVRGEGQSVRNEKVWGFASPWSHRPEPRPSSPNVPGEAGLPRLSPFGVHTAQRSVAFGHPQSRNGARMLVDFRRQDQLLRVLGPLPARGTVVGVEQEWCVHGESGRVDYRALHDRSTNGLVRLFPGDPAAVMTEAGTVLTVDGWEAETVTQPLVLGPGTLDDLDAALFEARSDLHERLRPLVQDVRLEGWSTHVSVCVDDDHVIAVARRLRERCGLSLALLLGAGVSGVLIRPRRHRLEVCLDHLAGPTLHRAVVAWVGLVLMCSDTSRAAGWRSLPRAGTTWAPARERFGHHCPLEGTGGARSATRTWNEARRYAAAAGLPTASVDRLLMRRDVDQPRSVNPFGSHPRAPDLASRTRPFGPAHARWLTWDLVAWECGDPGVMAVVPMHANHLFVAALDAGRLDSPIKDRLTRHRTVPRDSMNKRRSA